MRDDLTFSLKEYMEKLEQKMEKGFERLEARFDKMEVTYAKKTSVNKLWTIVRSCIGVAFLFLFNKITEHF